MAYGREQALIETNPIKRLAFRCLGATHLGDRSRNHYLMRALRKIPLPEDACVLNAGCANGAHSFYLVERFPNWTITGIEIDREQVARASAIAGRKKIKNIQFQAGDLHETRFTERFHLIFCMHVLTYLRDDQEVLRRFYRAMRPGGYLILSVPTPPAPSRLPQLIRTILGAAGPASETQSGRATPSRGPLNAVQERVGYSDQEITEKLRRAGLEPLFLTHPAGPLWQAAWEIHTALEGKGALRAVVHPFLLFLVDLDQWQEKDAPYPAGRDCVVIAQKPA